MYARFIMCAITIDYVPVSVIISALIMAALRSRCGHNIFAVWFLLLSSSSFFLSSPNLSVRRVDVYQTSTHGVTLVRI